MECPHLSENVKIGNTILLEKRDVMTKDWMCAVCSTTQHPWLCLHCGIVNCGRTVNGHAKDHSEQHSNHTVCMDCDNLAVFCYVCDEYVANDTKLGALSQLRQSMGDGKGGGGDGDPWNQCDNPVHNGRTLRPRSRKRSHSVDSGNGSVENIQCGGRPRRRTTNGHMNKAAKREKKVVGLRNLGNTCFMNAVLQSLSNIREFCLYFKQLPSLEGGGATGRRVYQSQRSIRELSDALMAEELRKFLIALTEQGAAKGAISPESLFLVIWKVVPRFRGYQQQDAHEFLRYVLDRLHTELLHLLPEGAAATLKGSTYISCSKGRSSIVTSIFGGTLQSEVRCLNCSVESKKHDPFLDLSLDIPDKCHTHAKKAKENGDDRIPPCNILDCLTSFIEVEELAETELYYCDNCESKQRSTKRFWIRRLPNVLCLHLKRFRWHNCLRTKVDTSIVFPVTALDMSQFVLSDLPDPAAVRRGGGGGPSLGTNLYDLAAVIVHHGSGAGSGHYTAFAINDGQWFHFNDSTVRPTQCNVVAKCKPYIMFYIKREFRLPIVHS